MSKTGEYTERERGGGREGEGESEIDGGEMGDRG